MAFLDKLPSGLRQGAIACVAATALLSPVAAQEDPAPAAQEDEQVYGDWAIRCDQIPDGGTQCALTQAVEAEDRSDVWLNAYVFRPADGGETVLLSILVPLRVILTRGLGLKIDDADTTFFDFITCSEEGCLASIALTDELMAALRGGSEALFIIYYEDQAGIGVPISLAGFSAGLDALE